MCDIETILSSAFAAALELLESRASEQSFLELLEQVYGATGSDDAAFAAAAGSLQQLLGSGGELGIQVKTLDSADMNGAMGAYSSTGLDGVPVIYINTSLLSEGSDPELLQRVLLEEIGHHFDILLNGSIDTTGDEGELFADLISGDTLTLDQQSAITTQSDTGAVQVDGQIVSVEQATTAITITTAASATNDSTPTINGTYTSNNTGGGNDVYLWRRTLGAAQNTGVAVGNVAGNKNQNATAWSLTQGTALANGDYTFYTTTTNSNVALARSSVNITIDTAAPTVSSIAYGTNNGNLAAGETITLLVNFSENVNVTGTPTLALNSGGTASYSSGTGTNQLTFTYTPASPQTTTDLATTASAFSGTITDAAGNAVVASGFNSVNPAGTVAVDTTPPTGSLTLTPPTDNGIQGDGIAIGGTFSIGDLEQGNGWQYSINSGST